MAQTYSTELQVTQTTPADVPSASDGYGAAPKRYRASIALAAQAIGDTVVLANVPPGMVFAYGVVNTDTSLGLATLAVGNASSAAKYRAAATFTATNTPTLFGANAAVGAAASSATEQVIATVGAAALPASGNLVVDLYFTNAA